ncbi:MAG: type II toxin-antitoxin system Phd/YefM family antitoxin [Desulfobacterales bacterium]
MNIWQLTEAKKHLNAIIEEAVHTGPQILAYKGSKKAVILSIQEYERLSSSKMDLVDFFRDSPLYGMELDLDRDKDTSREVEL